MRDDVLFASAKSYDDRVGTATACVRKLGIKIPALLDGIDNLAEHAYTGWPDRLYVIGKGGRIQFKSAPGPFGFSTKALERALAQATTHGSAGTAPTARIVCGGSLLRVHDM